MSYKQKTLLLIVIATLLKMLVASTINLGNDEVYYRMYAQELKWNYFDHPPMVGWLIRFTTFNLTIDTTFFIRLGAILCSTIVTWLFYLCGKKISNEQTGFYAASIYTATVYGSIIAGTFILPDSPQMLCWILSLYLLLRITDNNHINKTKKKAMLFFGIVVGLGMLCKIHSIFLWVALILYVFLYCKSWFKQPVFYIAMLITGLFFLPVILWNIDNSFITYLYHSKRVDVTLGGIDIANFFTFIAAQLLYCNPIIIFFILKGAVNAFKNNLPVLSSHSKILLLSSLPLIFTAICISFFKQVLPHWIGPAYSGLILLTACLFTKNTKRTKIKFALPTPITISLFFVLFISMAGIILINFYPGTLGSKSKNNIGDGDFTLDMYGWNTIKTDVNKIMENDIENGLMKRDAKIISNKWFPASHIDFYIAMPLKKELLAIGDTSDIHQYAWINNTRLKLKKGDDAYFIVPSNTNCLVVELMKNKFEIVQKPDTIIQKRNNTLCREFYLWRLKNYLVNISY